MEKMERLIAETVADLQTVGFFPRPVVRWSVNTRAKRRWGLCRKVTSATFAIEIAERLLRDGVPDQTVKNVMAHELLHTLPGCFGHRGPWKAAAQTVCRALPAYRIQTTDSLAEGGFPPDPETVTPRYAVVCRGCGAVIGRTRRSQLIDHPDRYRCAKCGGRLERQETGKT